MRGARYMLLCVAVLGALSLLGPASALAASCGGSAGDSQYVDPLQNCGGGGHNGGGHHSTSHAASGSSSQTTTTVADAGTSTSSAQPTATTATTSASTTTGKTGKKDPKGGGSLPFTGLNLVSALIVAAALIAGGVWLRWVGRERRPHWR